MSKLLDDVVSELSRLPGVGRRTAMRLAMHMLRMEEHDVMLMTQAMARFRSDIRYCSRCNNLSDGDVCEICSDATRDRSTVCVVEQVKDVLSIENTRQYNGLYHVLGASFRRCRGSVVRPEDRPAARPSGERGCQGGDPCTEYDGRRRDHFFLYIETAASVRRSPSDFDRSRDRVRGRVGLCRRPDHCPCAA